MRFTRAAVLALLVASLSGCAGGARAGGCSVTAVHLRRIRADADPVALVRGFGSVWALGAGSLSRLDPASGRVLAEVRTPRIAQPGEVAIGAGSVWVTAAAPAAGVVERIDPRADRVIATWHPAPSVGGIAVGSGRVWITEPRAGAGLLLAFDPRTGRRAGPAIEVGAGPAQVVYGLRHVWVQDTSPPSVVRVDPRTRAVATVAGAAPWAPGAPGPGTIAVSRGRLWSLANGSLRRLAAGSGSGAGSRTGSGRAPWSAAVPRGVALAFGAGRAWVLSYPRSRSTRVFEPVTGTAAIWEVDLRGHRTTRVPVRLGMLQPTSITVLGHALWLAGYGSSTVTRIGLACTRA